jgi:hypothetical protein
MPFDRTAEKTILISAMVISILMVAEISSRYISNNQSYAQTASQKTASPQTNVTKILSKDYPFVKVEYQGNSTIVLKGDEDSLLLLKGSLTPFWQAIDKVKEYGYTLNDVTTSGMGSQGNPTRFYAILSKNPK